MTDNPEVRRARQIIEYTGVNLFLTGKAGTGKTTFLRQLREQSTKRMVVLAPTGIAAINAGGVTIHSFFQLSFAPFVPGSACEKHCFKLGRQKIKLFRSLDLVVIDEISMVRADLLDSVDSVLRRYRNSSLPFGGVQLLLIGDLQQLAPVVKDDEKDLLKEHYETPFFFSSKALRQAGYVTIELQHVYRQSDPEFIELLNCIREGCADVQTLQRLNARYIPNFRPARNEGYIHLVTHNRQAVQINEEELAQIPGPSFSFEAKVEGIFPENSYPTDAQLLLKRGAQVMFVKNNKEKGFFNGMLGEVTTVSDNGFKVRPLEAADEIIVEAEEWTNVRYELDEESKEIVERVEGRFLQYPVRPAWAITIHKSQGLTFERTIIDAHSAFAHGQTYVALSRCKTLAGLVLSAPISETAIIADAAVKNYTMSVVGQSPDDAAVTALMGEYRKQLLLELFDFTRLRYAVSRLSRHLEEHFSRLYPDALERMRTEQAAFDEQVYGVAVRFQRQLRDLLSKGDEAQLQVRVQKGAAYFQEQVSRLHDLAATLKVPSDNKTVVRRTADLLTSLKDEVRLKLRLTADCAKNGFSAECYLRARAMVVADEGASAESCRATRPQRLADGRALRERVVVPQEVRYPKIYGRLIDWRYQKSHELELPAYTILQQKALLGIANLLPETREAFAAIPYFATVGMEKYGAELLDIVRDFLKTEAVERPKVETVPYTPPGNGEKSRENTYNTTLRLYRENLSVDAVTQARQLSRATILKHLARLAAKGEVSVE